MLDVGTVLSETRETPPCGPNLEHNLPDFELEEAARGKPEQRSGDAVKPAEDPNWPRVTDLALATLLRSKDLRVAVHLTRALASTEGIPGLATGLGLIHGLLERYWDGIHPLLEADYNNDPTAKNPASPRTMPQLHARIAFTSDRSVPSAGAQGIDLAPLLQPLACLLEACDTALGARTAEADGVRTGRPRQRSLCGPGRCAAARDGVTLQGAARARHPAPLLIQRAQRLIQMNFLEIVKDLMPDSLSQIEKLAGEIEKS